MKTVQLERFVGLLLIGFGTLCIGAGIFCLLTVEYERERKGMFPVDINRAFLEFAVGIAAFLIGYRARHPKKPQVGKCAKCGYDLRATPSRCPECGTAVVAQIA